MPDDQVSATIVIPAPPEAVFAVLADPAQHAAIAGTGWVGRALDGEELTAVGQVFRMAMSHRQHPDGDYTMANEVQVLEAPHAISWRPGQHAEDGTLTFGGWVWRYDLAATGADTTVTLTYDWSAVPAPIRSHIGFPPFPPNHLTNSLANLATLVAR